MKILIATGIYPPQLGGPATYAKNIKDAFLSLNHTVSVKRFTIENKLPTGIRHICFFFKSFFSVLKSDFSLSLDTFSVGAPIVLASKILNKKSIIRIGGDFLWESYLNRTGEYILLSEFYGNNLEKLNLKEKLIFSVSKWVLKNADAIVFSTNWQKEIFVKNYNINKTNVSVIENFYGSKIDGLKNYEKSKKVFVSGVRNIKWKRGFLDNAFSKAQSVDQSLFLDKETCDYDCFLEKIKNSYAVILVSLADISPNTILDAVRCNKPFILTKENGLDRLKEIAILVDPKNEDEIKEKILWLANPENYLSQKRKIEAFSFTHSWEEMANEFINIFKKI